MTPKEKAALQKEVVDSLDPNPHGRLLLAPRSGKTKMIIDLIKRDKPVSILWVTPSAKLATEDIPSEFDKWSAKRYKKKLHTSTWMSLNKVSGHYDLIVLDEDQFITENNAENLLNGSLSGNIISMTGTPTKHEDKIALYNKLGLKTLYQITINQAVDIGLLANYNIKVVEVDMSTANTIEAGNKNSKFMTSEVKQYDYLTRVMKQAIFQKRKDVQFRILNRLHAIKNSPSKLEAAKFLIEYCKGRKLIFSAGIQQAEELCDYTYHSKTSNEDLKKFQSGEIDEIAMVNAGGTGFTYVALDHFIITQIDSDKNGLTSQKISRTLLQQPDYEAVIWILCLAGTQDEKWVEAALENFDKSKVEYIRFKNMKNGRI